MVILHYIPSLGKKAGQTSTLVQRLHAALGNTVESHLFTGEITIKEFVQKLKDIKPDILHIHGCWDIHLAIAQLLAARQGYLVIISPHNALSPDTLETDFWTSRLPRIILYQFLAIRKAFVLHAATQQETADLKDLGWKKRIAFIPLDGLNASDTQAAADVAEQFRILYRKVIDTRLRNTISDNERDILFTLIRQAVTPAVTPAAAAAPVPPVAAATPAPPVFFDQVEEQEKQRQALAALSEHTWKNIQIYAIDHRADHLLFEGLKRIQYTIPVRVTQLPSRYTIKQTLQTKSHIPIDTDDTNERDIITTIAQLHHILCLKEAEETWPSPIHLLAKLYATLRYTDYDEENIMRQLQKKHLADTAARTMHILAALFSLSVGFMPLNPINDKKTRQMLCNLNNISYNIPQNNIP